MFCAIRKDIVSAADDFTTNLSSVEFAFRVGGEVIQFSQTDRPIDPIDVYPLFIPCLARAMFESHPRPYDRLKTLLEARRDIVAAQRIVFATFMNCDFCTLSVGHRKAAAALQLRPTDRTAPRQCETALALVANGRIVASDPDLPWSYVVIECNDTLEVELTRWCRRQYWRMFVATAAAVAAHFGFGGRRSAAALTVLCEDGRIVEFQGRAAESGEIVVNISEGTERLRIRWHAIPIAGHFQRLSYLFFFPVFRH
jgi:hypothetical protein